MIFDTLMESLKNYREKYFSQFEIKYQNIIDEIDIRINNLIIEYTELMELNKLINEKTPLKITTDFDPETNKLTIQFGDKSIEMKFKRKDENVPITPVGQADLYAFQPKNNTEDIMVLEKSLSTKLEAYYYSANKLLALIESLPKVSKFKFIGITMVRNKLIEHTEAGSPYSFGTSSSSGPIVKPIKKGTSKWNDKGLTSNTVEMVENITKKINNRI